jgi:hypothetical protein
VRLPAGRDIEHRRERCRADCCRDAHPARRPVRRSDPLPAPSRRLTRSDRRGGTLVRTESGVRARSDNPRSRGPAPDFRRAQLPPRRKRRPRPARHRQHFMPPWWAAVHADFRGGPCDGRDGRTPASDGLVSASPCNNAEPSTRRHARAVSGSTAANARIVASLMIAPAAPSAPWARSDLILRLLREIRRGALAIEAPGTVRRSTASHERSCRREAR